MSHEFTLIRALDAWNTPRFRSVLKEEIEALDAALLPLQQGLTRGGVAAPDGFTVMILAASDDDATLRATAGIHFTGIIAGCACADDPSPDAETAEYCEVLFEIDRRSGRATVRLLAD